jgi:uncharacterized protein
MSDTPHSRVPEILDAWKMVAAQREFEGRIPLASMPRLRDSLLQPDGDARFVLTFGTDAMKLPVADLRIEAELPLECQRSLRRFLLPVQLAQRLALVRDEAEEEGVPPDYDVLLVEGDGMLKPAELVEDELILALPVVAVAPDAEVVEREFAPTAEETAQANPFAALAGLKKE